VSVPLLQGLVLNAGTDYSIKISKDTSPLEQAQCSALGVAFPIGFLGHSYIARRFAKAFLLKRFC
jgi:hypothetical protein